MYLLNGLSDDCPEISQQCRDFLELHGNRMKATLDEIEEGRTK